MYATIKGTELAGKTRLGTLHPVPFLSFGGQSPQSPIQQGKRALGAYSLGFYLTLPEPSVLFSMGFIFGINGCPDSLYLGTLGEL